MKQREGSPTRISTFLFTTILGLILLLLILWLRQTAQVMGEEPTAGTTQLSDSLEEASSTTPPDASKITIAGVNLHGMAVVSGDSGTVPGGATVLIVNLSSGNLITATASTQGAFSANLFAPPGSTILVKVDSDGDRIRDYWKEAQGGLLDTQSAIVNPLPGATIPVVSADLSVGEFESAGSFSAGGWAGWWLTGTLSGPDGQGDYDVQPGEMVTVEANLWITSPDMNCLGTPTFNPSAVQRLRYLFNDQGRAQHWGVSFVSHLFTPTGLPIEHAADGKVVDVGSAFIEDRTCVNLETASGTFTITYAVPIGIENGLYRPELTLIDGGVPLTPGEKQAFIWHHQTERAALPFIVVGSPSPPIIPWTLMPDYLSNGHRGITAREEQGHFTMLTRVMLPPQKTVLPMLEERTSEPITYRLDPGSPWLSSTDRRLPNPPLIPISFLDGQLKAAITNPDGVVTTIGPRPILGSSVRTPTIPGGEDLHEGTGHIGDIYHLFTGTDGLEHQFDQYGEHTILLTGFSEDIYGNVYPISSTYDLVVARFLDLDPAQLPTTPYKQGDAFAPGLHVYPPLPADVKITLVHMPMSDPAQATERIIQGTANAYGYFQPPAGTEILFNQPGEFRVDISAEYESPDGTLWSGYLTWGNVVEGENNLIEAHGRRGSDFQTNEIKNTPTWFIAKDLPEDKKGMEIYYPYFSGDLHWGDQTPGITPGESIHTILSLKDLTNDQRIYDLIRDHFDRAKVAYRTPPVDYNLAGLNDRLAIQEAPLFITTASGADPAIIPDDIDLWGYWYGSSERPDVHVREIIAEETVGTAYWRFNDTYGYQIGEPADGDQPGDIKWEFGGVVFRTVTETNPINEYGIYSSLWVLLPENDPVGARITPPFRNPGGATIDGGPILTYILDGQIVEVDMLFLPKGIRPGDILEKGDTVAFSGHVGPPLNSTVSVTITSPAGYVRCRSWEANKIGWIYDPSFDFKADEDGRWTVDVQVVHNKPYLPTGHTPDEYNEGTVLGTAGRYDFYVVKPDQPRLFVLEPDPGFITWPSGKIEPITIHGVAPRGTTELFYTVHDKGVVMDQGSVKPDQSGEFELVYDAVELHKSFSMLSLTARDARREGLADEVTIHFLAVGGDSIRTNSVTLIGEEIFVNSPPYYLGYLPALSKK